MFARNILLHSFLLSITVCLSITSAFGFDRSVFENLDYGMYWYSYDQAAEKAIPGQYNPYYDPNKPTVIYIHGWQNNTTTQQSREDFVYSANGGPDFSVADAWVAAGWNVGVCYWNQFADEAEVKDAEAKVWSAQGPKAMRWRDVNGDYHEGPSRSASELCAESYGQALADYRGSHIRLVGHSLGNQMVIATAKVVSDLIDIGDLPSHLLPTRIALLDPAYLKGERDFLGGMWTGEFARVLVGQLKEKGVIFESYRTSGSTSNGLIGDTNTELLNMTAFTELKPWYFGWFDFTNKHISAVWHYFWSFQYLPPTIKDSALEGASAQTTDERIYDLMNSSQKLVHDLGAWTKTPEDDRMKLVNR